MKKCAYCGRESPDDVSHCRECGTPFIPQELRDPASFIVSAAEVTQGAGPPKEFRCGYCGRVNPIDASHCGECGTVLAKVENGRTRTVSEASQAEVGTTVPAASPPDSWSGRDAWKFLGMMLVFDFMLSGISGASWTVLHWHRGGVSHLVLDLANYTIKILTALYFARTESWALFKKAFGFELGPTTYTWFAIASALIIRGFGHALIAAGWSKGVYINSIWNFRHTFGLERYLYAFPLIILAPLCEEIFMRGFLYRAFRGSYSVAPSILLIVSVTAYTHWDQFSQSGIAVVDITAMTIVQCYLRERTGRLQDCILSHFAFNASGLLLSTMRH